MFDAIGLSPVGFAAIFATVFVGAVVQGSIGFGLNLIVVPAIAAHRPDALPAAAIILAIPMTLGSALREHAHIDRAAILWATLGRLPGIALGVAIVTCLDDERLTAVIGTMVVVAVLMSALSPRVPVTRTTQAVAGFLGGAMGTASSIGGPPLALLYQHSPGPVVRATLGAAFLVGIMLSLAALGVAGEVQRVHWSVGVSMIPAVLLGLRASRFFHRWLDAGWLRPCVLAACGLAGVAIVVQAWAGR